MRFNNLFLLFALSLITFSACTKDDEPDNMTTDPILGTWLLTASTGDLQTTDMGNPQTVDTYSLLPACEKDNTLEITLNGELTIFKNALCDPEERPEHDGSWSLEDNDTKLWISGTEFAVMFGEDEVTMDVISLTQEELIFTVKRSVGGFDVLDELTWEKQ